MVISFTKINLKMGWNSLNMLLVARWVHFLTIFPFDIPLISKICLAVITQGFSNENY